MQISSPAAWPLMMRASDARTRFDVVEQAAGACGAVRALFALAKPPVIASISTARRARGAPLTNGSRI